MPTAHAPSSISFEKCFRKLLLCALIQQCNSNPRAPALECGLTPLYLRVHESDNAAIIVAPEGATLLEHIPQSHKVALASLDTAKAARRAVELLALPDCTDATGLFDAILGRKEKSHRQARS